MPQSRHGPTLLKLPYMAANGLFRGPPEGSRERNKTDDRSVNVPLYQDNTERLRLKISTTQGPSVRKAGQEAAVFLLSKALVVTDVLLAMFRRATVVSRATSGYPEAESESCRHQNWWKRDFGR